MEIKFRAWHKDKKWMFENIQETYDGLGNDMRVYDIGCSGYFARFLEEQEEGKVIVMQFTGFEDKNGKEIYEGDILKQGEGEHETLIEVRFGNGTFDSGQYNFTGFYGVWLRIGFGGGFKPGDLCENMDEITQEECGRREVIGNIYENPELMEVEDD